MSNVLVVIESKIIPSYKMQLHIAHKARQRRSRESARRYTKKQDKRAIEATLERQATIKSLDEAKQKAEDKFDRENPIHAVIRYITIKHGLTIDNIKSNSRMSNIVLARWECFHTLRKKGYPLTLIGKVCCNNHATVISGIESYNRLLRIRKGEKILLRKRDVKFLELMKYLTLVKKVKQPVPEAEKKLIPFIGKDKDLSGSSEFGNSGFIGLVE